MLSYPHAIPAVFTDNLHKGDAVFRLDYKIRLESADLVSSLLCSVHL